jgi:hypothetical protein
MEHAPLRPVPTRPVGPVYPEAAERTLVSTLHDLGGREARALALVALAGRPRSEAAGELGIGPGELAEALASGRKALRRSLQPLTASGWCERAERLISDRLDGELEEPGAPRLDVHLRNCPRCVEHERRLVQATDLLTAEAAGSAPPSLPAAPAPAPAELRVVRTPEREQPEEPPATEPSRSGRQLASGFAWNLLIVVAVMLAIASLALVVAGVLGADL